ncbi:MAG: phosphoribosylamine--glycine ligase [Chloroflexi bacterium]|nr:phosphoribosylamine--glycine ligase [Chloroflexota bacterium]MDA1002194.1 phosphoribosylamine--glycine ligase [Chloroflexota bacterium]
MSLNVLLLGSGAREHAMAWRIAQSELLSKLWIAPGNVGTDMFGENVPATVATHPEGVIALATRIAADLVIVGPENPLAAGVVDRLEAAGFRVCGATAAAAEIESSKSFAKELMAQAGIATADARAFDDADKAKAYVRAIGYHVVVKADGLAAGKGVTVCGSVSEAERAIDEAMRSRAFGDAGDRIVIEERMYGREASAHAFTDGVTVRHMPFSCDHKPVFDGDRGPNTGGMGVYSPPGWLDAGTTARIRVQVTERAVGALTAAGRPFRGVIYPGIMITEAGPRVVEFNARMGDPEAEVLLPKLRTDLLEICDAIADTRLVDVPLAWDSGARVGVIMASAGYPGDYETGHPISGLDDVDDDVQVFFAGAARDAEGRIVTAGGRVLCVVAGGDTVEAAREQAYDNVRRISFEGAHFRTDIGATADEPLAAARA